MSLRGGRVYYTQNHIHGDGAYPGYPGFSGVVLTARTSPYPHADHIIHVPVNGGRDGTGQPGTPRRYLTPTKRETANPHPEVIRLTSCALSNNGSSRVRHAAGNGSQMFRFFHSDRGSPSDSEPDEISSIPSVDPLADTSHHEVDALRQSLEAANLSLEKAQKDNESLAVQIRSLLLTLGEEEEKNVAGMSALRQECDTLRGCVVDLEDALAEVRQQLQQQEASWEEEKETLAKRYDADTQAMVVSHLEELANLTSQHRTEVERLTEECNREKGGRAAALAEIQKLRNQMQRGIMLELELDTAQQGYRPTPQPPPAMEQPVSSRSSASPMAHPIPPSSSPSGLNPPILVSNYGPQPRPRQTNVTPAAVRNAAPIRPIVPSVPPAESWENPGRSTPPPVPSLPLSSSPAQLFDYPPEASPTPPQVPAVISAPSDLDWELKQHLQRKRAAGMRNYHIPGQQPTPPPQSIPQRGPPLGPQFIRPPQVPFFPPQQFAGPPPMPDPRCPANAFTPSNLHPMFGPGPQQQQQQQQQRQQQQQQQQQQQHHQLQQQLQLQHQLQLQQHQSSTSPMPWSPSPTSMDPMPRQPDAHVAQRHPWPGGAPQVPHHRWQSNDWRQQWLEDNQSNGAIASAGNATPNFSTFDPDSLRYSVSPGESLVTMSDTESSGKWGEYLPDPEVILSSQTSFNGEPVLCPTYVSG